uniref:Carboxypeptidase Q n=1 Tax=Rhipicephalus appendiculatus TaxID=34631 RepID=A0A131Z1M1_RHIAP
MANVNATFGHMLTNKLSQLRHGFKWLTVCWDVLNFNVVCSRIAIEFLDSLAEQPFPVGAMWPHFFICAVLVLDAAVVTQSQNQYKCHGNTALPRRLVREIRSYKPIVEKIIDMVVYGAEQNVTYDELAIFVDRFGARPSGSKTLEDSIDYMVDILRGHRLDCVHTEEARIEIWRRGREGAWILKPRKKKMNILGLGNSVGTPAGGITAPVLVVKSFEELKRNARKAKGKIVVFNQAFVSYDKTVKYREHGATEAAKAGAVAALVRSVTPFSINSPHTGVMEYGKNTPRIPTASITLEDAELLARWQDRGIKPVIKLVMGAKRLPPGVSRNTIAEIRGRTKPKEVVAVSGHIDSWDVGQGAMDDGAGAFIAWRALAVLRRLGLRPRRTLRSILFTGEEQGITGAMDYFERHFPHERNLLNVVMESDSGTFRPLGLAFSGSNKRARCIVAEVLSLFASINATLLTLGVLEPDLEPWIKQGVPALALNTADERYFYFHHTEADTMSVLDRHELDLCTALWAAASYIFADLSIRLPR